MFISAALKPSDAVDLQFKFSARILPAFFNGHFKLVPNNSHKCFCLLPGFPHSGASIVGPKNPMVCLGMFFPLMSLLVHGNTFLSDELWFLGKYLCHYLLLVIYSLSRFPLCIQ